MMKLRTTALALTLSAVVGDARRGPGPRRPLPVRRDDRHGRQRPVGQRPPRGDRQRQRRHRLERRPRPDPAGRQRRNGSRGPAAGRPADGARRRHDRLRRAALEHDAAGTRVRVRPDGGQRRLPDRHARRGDDTAPGVDRRSGREPGGADRGRARVAAREHVDPRGGDGQGRGRLRARAAAAVRGRRS